MNTYSTQHLTESALTAPSTATYPFTWHRSPHLGQQSSQVDLQTAAAAPASTQPPQCTPQPRARTLLGWLPLPHSSYACLVIELTGQQRAPPNRAGPQTPQRPLPSTVPALYLDSHSNGCTCLTVVVSAYSRQTAAGTPNPSSEPGIWANYLRGLPGPTHILYSQVSAENSSTDV